MNIWPEGAIFLSLSIFVYAHFVASHLKLRSINFSESKPVRWGTVIGTILSSLSIVAKNLIESTHFFRMRTLFECAGLSLILSGLIVIILDSQSDHHVE